ncbi:hypothetical protein EV1_005910 [Malus domestica]
MQHIKASKSQHKHKIKNFKHQIIEKLNLSQVERLRPNPSAMQASRVRLAGANKRNKMRDVIEKNLNSLSFELTSHSLSTSDRTLHKSCNLYSSAALRLTTVQSYSQKEIHRP